MLSKLFLKKNKGVAMITIMITVAFLSIIATSLLYISSSNYAMKSANSRGKKNFYDTDAKLVEATTAIRNCAMNGGDPAENIATAICVDGTTLADLKDETKTSYYDISKVAALVDSTDYTFKTSNNVITVKDHPSESNVKRYTLNDIEVIHTSSSGFDNSVKTDLVIDIYEKTVGGGGGGGGVGNMSMLLDSPLSSESEAFKNLTMAGNAFVADYDDPTHPVNYGDGKYIKPGSKGLVMNNDSKINLCGDFNVVYGDLKLSKNASLVCYGNLTVYGNIEVKDEATLIMADGANLYQFTSANLPGRTSPATFTAGTKNVYPSDLASKISSPSADDFKEFCKAVNIYNTTGNDYGLISKIFVKGPKDKNGNQPFGANTRLLDLDPAKGEIKIGTASGLTKTDKDLAVGYDISSSIYGLPTFGVGFIEDQKTDLNNLNSDNYKNKLLLSFNRGKITLLQTCPNTTWISNGPVTCDKEHNVVLSKIGSTEFNYMTAGKGDSESKCYDTDTNPFNHISIDFDGKQFNGKLGALFEKGCNDTVDSMFGYAASDGSGGGGGGSTTKVYSSSICFDNYSRDFIFE